MEYITVMPAEDAEHKRGHKYPFVSSEIFNCEMVPMIELFFTCKADEEKKEEETSSPSEKKASVRIDEDDDEVITKDDDDAP